MKANAKLMMKAKHKQAVKDAKNTRTEKRRRQRLNTASSRAKRIERRHKAQGV